MRQPDTADLTLAAAADTEALGAELGRALRATPSAPLVIALSGPLGAGKTTLARSVLRSLGVTGAIRSPTYTLIEPYEVPGRSVQHLDLYRLTDPSEVEALGLRDLLVDGTIVLIEWPEHGGAAIPEADLTLQLSYADGGAEHRSVSLIASSANGRSVLQALVGAST